MLTIALAMGTQLLVAGAATAAAPAAEPGVPWISSDLPDYAPGAPVHLDGGSWQAGEVVHIYVNDDQGRTWERTSDVVADGDGVIADDFTLPNWFVATYQVTATGELSGVATTSFTDSNVHLELNPTTAGAQITRTLYSTVNCSGQGTATTGLTDVAVDKNQSLRLDSTNGSAGQLFQAWTRESGNMAFTVIPGTGGASICVVGEANQGGSTFRATYTAPAAVATTLSVSTATGTYGGGAPLTATLKKTSDNTAVAGRTISFSLNGTSVGTATTNASGVATLNGVSLAGINAATYATGVAASFAGDSGFGASSGTASLTVNKAPLQLTADNKTKTYGDANPALTYSVSGLVGSDTQASALTTEPTLGTAAATANAGSYPITISGGTSTNYSLSHVAGTLTVDQAQLTVKADDQARAYGDDNPTLTFSVSGLKNGDSQAAALTAAPSLSTTAVKASPLGSYPITVSGGTSANYTLTRTDGTLTVGKRAITVTAQPKTKVYGDTDPALTYTVTSGSLAAGDSFSGSLSRAPGEDVASYTITQGTLSAGPNYVITYQSSTLTITPAPLTVTVKDDTKIYGAANPAFDVTYSGFVNGEGPSALGGALSFSTPATSASSVGSYDVTASGLTSSNYAITFKKGTLTVTPASLTVTVKPASKSYGAPNPSFEVAYAGFVNGDDEGDLDGTLAFHTTADATSAVGEYDVTASGLTSNNYDISYVKGTLTVAKRAITVTADPQSKTYGNADPTLSYQVTSGSLAQGDAFSGHLVRDAGQDVGSYDITQGTLALSDNYALSFVGAKLTIGQRAVTVKADPQSKTYGETDPALTYQVTSGSLAYTDAFTGSLTRASGQDVGEYPITQGTLALNANYDLTFVGAKLTIGQRPVTVKADPQSKTYGNADPALTYDITAGSLAYTDTFTGALTRASGQDVGEYPITQGTLALNANYDLTYVGDKLTIGQRAVTVKADFRSKTYGDADPELTYQVTAGNVVAGDSFSGALVRDAGESVPGGPYAIKRGTLSLGSNYALSYVGDNLSITRRLLTVTALDTWRLLGAANPAFTGTVVGTQYNDQILVSYTTTATPASPVGPYDIVPVVASNPASVLDNYSLNKVNGTLRVVFAWDGFLQPINDTAHQVGTLESKFKLGQTIPVKFDLKDAFGNVVTQTGTPAFTRSGNLGSCDTATTLEAVPTVSPDGAAVYAYTGGHYQYNWSTKGLTAGEYRVFAHLADGSHQTVYICLTK